MLYGFGLRRLKNEKGFYLSTDGLSDNGGPDNIENIIAALAKE